MKKSGITHSKAKSLFGIIATFAVLTGVASTAPADLGLQYTFVQGVDDPTMPNGINDQSGKGHNGTVIDSTLAEFVAGPMGNMNALHIDRANFSDETMGSGINTGTPVDNPDLNIWLGPFTTMAWVNLDDQNGDHMVFGTPPPYSDGRGSLHLGFRGTAVYFGFWGAGAGRDSSVQSGFNAGEWHHVAWRFTGAGDAGNQDLFVDGQMFNSFAASTNYGGLLLGDGNLPNVVTNLLIGRTVANSAAFSGSLSDVRVYNEALTDDAIAAIAASPP
jgi:concanavalin A-like lectin/glucanase superfamily protein